MSLAGNSPTNTRLIRDSNFVWSGSFTSVATTANTASGVFDLVQATPYPVTEQIIAQIDTSAITSEDVAYTASLTWQDSATGTGVFTNVDGAGVKNVVSTAGSAAAVSTFQSLLPPGVKRYIRANLSAVTGSQAKFTELTGSLTASLLF